MRPSSFGGRPTLADATAAAVAVPLAVAAVAPPRPEPTGVTSPAAASVVRESAVEHAAIPAATVAARAPRYANRGNISRCYREERRRGRSRTTTLISRNRARH